MQDIKELSNLIVNLKTQNDVCKFLTEILTQKELSTLSKRWRILKLLTQGCTQREIANNLNVSLCKVTRGAKILKNKNSITAKILLKGKNNDN